MPTMAIGSSMESSELWVFSSMYGILTDVSILALTFDFCKIDFDCRWECFSVNRQDMSHAFLLLL